MISPKSITNIDYQLIQKIINYLQYKTSIQEYISAFWNIINWNVVNERFLSINCKNL